MRLVNAAAQLRHGAIPPDPSGWFLRHLLPIEAWFDARAAQRALYRHLPGTPIKACPRYPGAGRVFGIYAVVVLLGPYAWTLAVPQAASNTVQADEPLLFIDQDVCERRKWGIIRIVPPENSQELGTISFGEGQSFLEPSALRGPR
jgi:hypothetical protein